MIFALPLLWQFLYGSGTAWSRKGGKMGKSTDNKSVDNKGIDNEIAEIAFELYEKDGCRHGKDEAHWFEAERQLTARSLKAAGKGAAKPVKKSAKKPAKAPKAAVAKGPHESRRKGSETERQKQRQE